MGDAGRELAAELLSPLHRIGSHGLRGVDVPEPQLGEEAVERHREQIGLFTPLDAAFPDGEQLVAALLDLTGPRQQTGVMQAGPKRCRHMAGLALQHHRPLQRVLVEAIAAHEVQMHTNCQRLAGKQRESGRLGKRLGLFDARDGGLDVTTVEQRESQRGGDLGTPCRVVAGLAERPLQQRSGFEEVVIEQVHCGPLRQRLCAQRPFRQRLHGGLQQFPRGARVPGSKVVARGPNSALRRAVGVVADGDVEEFGRGGGRAARTRRARRLVEHLQRGRVRGRGAESEMTGLELGLVDHGGEPMVHRPAGTRRRTRVHALNQQRMTETDTVPVESDDPLVLGAAEQVDSLSNVAPNGLRHRHDRRRPRARHRQQ